jgi:hypothetical protein
MYLKQCEVESRIEFFKCDIQETIKSHSTIKKWAYILHDKDDTAPHFHVYLNFGTSGVDTKQVAEWFGLPETQVNKIKGRATDMLLYLTHGNDSQKNKHQYSPTEVIANFDFETAIENAKIIGDFEHYSYARQLEYVNTLPISEKASAFTLLEKLWKLQCRYLTLQTDRDIEVVFIYGDSSSGKTHYAKEFLKKRGYDFCVSSSSNDPFQDYLGQDGIILDDLRDRSFAFEDFLKIIDNHTASTVQSRFQNKVFNGKMIVITSSVPLRYWYRLALNDNHELLFQLYRRITFYIEMTRDEIVLYSEVGGFENTVLNKDGSPRKAGKVYKNNVKAVEKQAAPRTDIVAIFDKMLEPATADAFNTEQLDMNIDKQRR